VPVEYPGQELDRDQQGQRGPAGDDPADEAGAGGRDVRGQAPGCAGRERGPGQPPGFAAGAAIGEQDERSDDFDAVD
jgi:hypothetical protein